MAAHKKPGHKPYPQTGKNKKKEKTTKTNSNLIKIKCWAWENWVAKPWHWVWYMPAGIAGTIEACY